MFTIHALLFKHAKTLLGGQQEQQEELTNLLKVYYLFDNQI
jgi:hypothetical protein